MAIDTLRKRSAALRYGRGRTRQPEGTSSELLRSAGLGCYAMLTLAEPSDGWRTPSRQRVSVSEARVRAWIGPTGQRFAVSESHDRLMIPDSHVRLWIASDKVE